MRHVKQSWIDLAAVSRYLESVRACHKSTPKHIWGVYWIGYMKNFSPGCKLIQVKLKCDYMTDACPDWCNSKITQRLCQAWSFILVVKSLVFHWKRLWSVIPSDYKKFRQKIFERMKCPKLSNSRNIWLFIDIQRYAVQIWLLIMLRLQNQKLGMK